MHESEKWKWSHSVVSDSSWPHGLRPTRLLCPWYFPGKSAGVANFAFSLPSWWGHFVHLGQLQVLPLSSGSSALWLLKHFTLVSHFYEIFHSFPDQVEKEKKKNLCISLAALCLSCDMWTFSGGMRSFSCSMWDLVPWPGTGPRSPALGGWSLSHWTHQGSSFTRSVL